MVIIKLASIFKKKFLFFLLTVFAGWYGCGSETNTIDSFIRMEGVWVMDLGETQIYEEWNKVDDKLLQGISYQITGEDSTVSEHIQLIIKGADIYYVPTVANQNEGLPVSFKLTYQSDTLIVFENPEHDFPTKISYKFTGQNQLDASISGEIRGEIRTLDFKYSRIR